MSSPDYHNLRRIYDTQFDDVSAAVFVVHAKTGDILSCNTDAEELTGYEKKELQEINFSTIFRSEDQSRISSIFITPSKLEFRKLFEQNVIIQKRSRRKIMVDMGFRRSADNSKDVLIFTLQDITDLKQNEERLTRAHDYMNNVFSSMVESLFIIESSGLIQRANQAACTLLGHNEETLSRLNFKDILDETSKGMVSSILTHNSTEIELGFINKSDEIIPVLVSAAKLRSNADTTTGQTVVLAMDISERKKAERVIADQQMTIVQASKLSSLGEMASGIAHEINNPIHVISGRCEISEIELSKANPSIDELKSSIALIQSMADRIDKIIIGLRNISRDQRNDPMQRLQLSNIISDTLNLCRERIIQGGITLTTTTEKANETFIDCRPTQISQVILNLMNNAFDATLEKQGGAIELSVKWQGKDVLVIVKDNGAGIDPNIKEKIFEPFFTQKPLGHGTGLGLSISRSIAEDHRGKIELDNSNNETSFILKLPRSL